MYLQALTRRIFFLVVCVAAGFGPALASDEWKEVRSQNFVLVGNASENELRRMSVRLEQFRGILYALFPTIKLDGGAPTTVVVFNDAVSFAKFRPRRSDGSFDTAATGYFLSGGDVNYIAVLGGERPDAYRTVFHEYVHFLLDVNIGRAEVPPWLNEGLAEYFETVEFLDERRISLGAPPTGHLATLKRNELIPLTEFFAKDDPSLQGSDDRSRNLFYAQAWAAVHYLVHASQRGGVGVNRILETAKAAAPPSNVAASLLGSDYDLLTTELRKYVGRRQLQIRNHTLERPISFESNASTLSITKARALSHQGDLLRQMGQLAEAEMMLREALTLDPDMGFANRSLGLLLARKKDFSGARMHLEVAIAKGSTNSTVYFNYAYVISRVSADVSRFPAGDVEKMREALRRSIALDPKFVESYRLMAIIGMANDFDLREVVGFIEKGLSVKPGDQHLSLLLAEARLRQQKYAEAGSIAEKLATATSDPDILSKAQNILDLVKQIRAATAVQADDAPVLTVYGSLPPLILKRSQLTDTQVEQYTEERVVNNLNLMIDRPHMGERQVVGYIDKITCSGQFVNYSVRTSGERFNLVSNGFVSIGLRVLVEGQRSFTLDCGGGFGEQLTVLTFEPAARSKATFDGRLVSIVFVPDVFRLKSSEEMAKWRTVIIEDDRIFRDRSRAFQNPEKP